MSGTETPIFDHKAAIRQHRLEIRRLRVALMLIKDISSVWEKPITGAHQDAAFGTIEKICDKALQGIDP